MNDLDTVNAIRNAKSAVEAIRILRKYTEEVVKAEDQNKLASTDETN